VRQASALTHERGHASPQIVNSEVNFNHASVSLSLVEVTVIEEQQKGDLRQPQMRRWFYITEL